VDFVGKEGRWSEWGQYVRCDRPYDPPPLTWTPLITSPEAVVGRFLGSVSPETLMDRCGRLLTVKFRQPSHEFTFGVDISFILYPLVLTPLV
jgi:hypothetical protein